MKVVLVGYGKMGRLLEAQLTAKGDEVLAVVEPHFASGKSTVNVTQSGAPVYASLEDSLNGVEGKRLTDADAAIEFTHPSAVAGNLLFLAGKKIPTVTGSTGWYDRLDEVKRAVTDANTSLLWASNFSLGVNLFFRLAACAAALFDPFAEYDVGGFESHHNKKADSPSGTAKTLVERVIANSSRKKKAVYEMLERPPAPDELHYASVRIGSIPGTHSLSFDSPADTIEITHTARNREGFASGAILAAHWLVAEKRTGVFTMDDVLH